MGWEGSRGVVVVVGVEEEGGLEAGGRLLVGVPSRGKNIRKRNNLSPPPVPLSVTHSLDDMDRFRQTRLSITHITTKHPHCTPICATPSSAAVHSYPLTWAQHARAWRVFPMLRMLAKALVPEVVPSRM